MFEGIGASTLIAQTGCYPGKSTKCQAKLEEIKQLAKQLHVSVDEEDLKLANFPQLCLISIKLQLAVSVKVKV
jgi:hypothetical protein